MANAECARILALTAGMERALESEEIEAFAQAVEERQTCLDRLSGVRLDGEDRETLAEAGRIDGRISGRASALLARYRKRLQHFNADVGRMLRYESNRMNLSQGQVMDSRR